MVAMQNPPPSPPVLGKSDRHAVTFKLLFIVALVLLLQIPLVFVNSLRHTRIHDRGMDVATSYEERSPAAGILEGYRMVERSVKYGVLILTLVFAAFFPFEILADLRLHAVHYGLVGMALCLFYLMLLALGEVIDPAKAYISAAAGSSLLISLYSAAILRSRSRALLIAGLLTAVYGVLYIVLRMEQYALLAGTASLFVSLAAMMFFTRNVDWYALEMGRKERA